MDHALQLHDQDIEMHAAIERSTKEQARVEEEEEDESLRQANELSLRSGEDAGKEKRQNDEVTEA
jgi:hypothetical protein